MTGRLETTRLRKTSSGRQRLVGTGLKELSQGDQDLKSRFHQTNSCLRTDNLTVAFYPCNVKQSNALYIVHRILYSVCCFVDKNLSQTRDGG